MSSRIIWLMFLVPCTALADRKVAGQIKDRNGNPLANVRVEAWDEDAGADDKMGGPVATNSTGRYELSYRAGKWDPDVPGTTWWRPDIYIRVKARGGYCDDSTWVASDGWHEIKRSSATEDHRVAQDLTKNLTINDYPLETVHGQATLGQNMYCKSFFLRTSCFACIDDHKISWAEWGFTGVSSVAHPCGDATKLPNCSASDWKKIQALNTNLSDPGYYQ
jgi:hypothetical protein